MASTENPYEPPTGFDRSPNAGLRFAWLLFLLFLPTVTCALITLAVNKWVTQIGFLHLFLMGLPTPALIGLSISFATSEQLPRNRWAPVMFAGQILLVGLVYWQLREPFHNPFP